MFIFIFFSLSVQANSPHNNKLSNLQLAYPDQFKNIDDKFITWKDGTKMPLGSSQNHSNLDSVSLNDQITQAAYISGHPLSNPSSDPGRMRYAPLFLKMYGESEAMVKSKLTTIYWMKKNFGEKYPLEITTVNSINKKLMQVSNELEQLVLSHPEFLKFLDDPAGTFKWRKIENTHRLSPHSFGIAIDINDRFSDYWIWDLQEKHRVISENTALHYKNRIPWEIVAIFEKHGFIWGGKWYHYDTMHFEYRPELLVKGYPSPK
jgi:peptidoglycan LD-endopeptidase CwlK